MKKLFLAALMAWGTVIGLKADPIVRIDFPCENFWGQMTAVSKLPDGVWIGERRPFYDKKRKGYTHPVFIDLAKVTEIDIAFKFAGKGKASMKPALTGYQTDSMVPDEYAEIECTGFSVDDDRSVNVPCAFTHWKSMVPFIASKDVAYAPGKTWAKGTKYYQIFVVDGKTIRVKAAFKAPGK